MEVPLGLLGSTLKLGKEIGWPLQKKNIASLVWFSVHGEDSMSLGLSFFSHGSGLVCINFPLWGWIQKRKEIPLELKQGDCFSPQPASLLKCFKKT